MFDCGSPKSTWGFHMHRHRRLQLKVQWAIPKSPHVSSHSNGSGESPSHHSHHGFQFNTKTTIHDLDDLGVTPWLRTPKNFILLVHGCTRRTEPAIVVNTTTSGVLSLGILWGSRGCLNLGWDHQWSWLRLLGWRSPRATSIVGLTFLAKSAKW